MVAINKEKPITVPDAVCPNCWRPIERPIILPEWKDDYGRQFRIYYGYCFGCKLGFEVVQFLREDLRPKTKDQGQKGRWVVYKCQTYCYKGEDSECEKIGEFILNELPQPAPVVIGPGGDFNEQIEIKHAELLHTIEKSLNLLRQAFHYLLSAKTRHE